MGAELNHLRQQNDFVFDRLAEIHRQIAALNKEEQILQLKRVELLWAIGRITVEDSNGTATQS